MRYETSVLSLKLRYVGLELRYVGLELRYVSFQMIEPAFNTVKALIGLLDKPGEHCRKFEQFTSEQTGTKNLGPLWMLVQ